MFGKHPLGRHPLGRHPLGRHPQADTPPGRHPQADTPDTATAAEGTHPTGMHSCSQYDYHDDEQIFITCRKGMLNIDND